MRTARYGILLCVVSLSSNAASIYGTYTIDYTARVESIEYLNPAFDIAIGDTFTGYATFSVTTELVANALRFTGLGEQGVYPIPGTDLWSVVTDMNAFTPLGWDRFNNNVIQIHVSSDLTSIRLIQGGGGFYLDAYSPDVTSSSWTETELILTPRDGPFTILRGTLVGMTLRETPEPGTLTVVAAGLVAIGVSRQRRWTANTSR